MVVSGPSGVGKGTVLKHISSFKGVSVSVSATTRKPRELEKDGEDYYFISREEFLENIKKGEMVEYNEYCGNFYGTIKSKLEDLLKKNEIVLLEIDVNGASLVSKKLDCVKIFLLPPSFNELKKRLILRGTETKENVEKRLKQAYIEMKDIYSYDYVVVNDEINNAVEKIKSIAKAESFKVKRRKFEIEEILKSLL